jgi:hypothetical protein
MKIRNKLLLLSISFAFCSQRVNAQVPSYVPTNGLAGWWSFSGNANEESGTGNNGTVSSATLTTDRFGNNNKAYSFNGVNSKIVTADNLFQLNSSFTISSWINLSSLIPLNYDTAIVSQSVSTANGGRKFFCGYRKQAENKGLSLYLWDNTNTQHDYYPLDWSPQINIWYHVIWVYTPSTGLKIYINGQLSYQNSAAMASGINTSGNIPLTFGNATGFYPNFPFNGKIDDIGIWNRALTQQEINNLYNSQTVCQSIGQDSSALYDNGYVVGPENINCGQGIHTESKWISVTGAEILNITTFQHRLYDSSRIYNQNNQLIWQWNGEDTGAPTWYSRNHSVNVLGNDSVRIEFYQGYGSSFCNGYLKVTTMDCSNLSISDNEIIDDNLIKVFPNPANDYITIDCGNFANVNGWAVKIVNTLGQEIFNRAMNQQQTTILFNTLNSQGIYFVKIYDNKGSIIDTKKIILKM